MWSKRAACGSPLEPELVSSQLWMWCFMSVRRWWWMVIVKRDSSRKWCWLSLKSSFHVWMCYHALLLAFSLQVWMCVQHHPASSSALIILDELSAPVTLAIDLTEKDTATTNLHTAWVSASSCHLQGSITVYDFLCIVYLTIIKCFIRPQACITLIHMCIKTSS